jgi:hypothetical protein
MKLNNQWEKEIPLHRQIPPGPPRANRPANMAYSLATNDRQAYVRYTSETAGAYPAYRYQQPVSATPDIGPGVTVDSTFNRPAGGVHLQLRPTVR